MWDLIASVPDHCLSFYFATGINYFPCDIFQKPVLGISSSYKNTFIDFFLINI